MPGACPADFIGRLDEVTILFHLADFDCNVRQSVVCVEHVGLLSTRPVEAHLEFSFYLGRTQTVLALGNHTEMTVFGLMLLRRGNLCCVRLECLVESEAAVAFL